MGLSRHQQTDMQRRLCHHCGYDMAGQEEGDLCLECGTPFDRRPDHPGVEKRTIRGLTYMVLSLLAMPVLMPLSFLFYYLAIRIHYWLNSLPLHARLSYRIRMRHRLMLILMYVWMIEFIAALWLDAIWPPFMDWW